MPPSILDIFKNWDDIGWWRTRLLERVIRPIHTGVYPADRGAIRVMDQDWDNLIVLDACRYDVFKSKINTNQFESFSQVRSLGSATPEWAQQNFSGKSFGDTVYVSSNPFISRYASSSFHDLVEVWRSDFDEESGTVTPEAMYKAAVDVHGRYPHKRQVFHFMQPHYPFRNMKFNGWHPDEIVGAEEHGDLHDPWDALREGVVTRQEVWEAYADNLDYCMEWVERLLDELRGKTVITSDHGNMFGEWGIPFPLRIYGHPERLRFRSLVNVPWGTVNKGTRRSIHSETTEESSEADQEEIKKKLKSLGYRG